MGALFEEKNPNQWDTIETSKELEQERKRKKGDKEKEKQKEHYVYLCVGTLRKLFISGFHGPTWGH